MSINTELLGATLFIVLTVLFFGSLLFIAPTHQEISEMPDKPLTVEQWNYYGLNQ